MNVPTKVYNFYWDVFDSLPLYEQFHFISRLFLVRGDTRAKKKIESIKNQYMTLSGQEIWDDLQNKLTNIATINHAHSRTFFLEKYPTIRKNARDLFVYFFAKKLFEIDLEQILEKQISVEWENLVEKLLRDRSALRELSAFVINFVLLFTHFKEKNNDNKITQMLYDLSKEIYNTNEGPIETEMWIYFLTHLIIGDTIFYIEPLSQKKESLYDEMVQRMERVIEEKYFEIHLDCKNEFLVCARLAGHRSKLESQILAESSASLSEKGDFIVDKYNANPQTHRTSAATSEHRNVLFILAFYEMLEKAS